MTLAERMIVMNAGRIEQIGSPEQVYQTPATTFVAGFIGSPPMNLLQGQAEGTRFSVDGQTLALPQAAPRNGPLLLGVRPEHAQMLGDAAADAAPRAVLGSLKVEMIEMLGAERLVYGRLGSALFTMRIDGTLTPPKPGSTVALVADAQRLHWFDPSTKTRL
jgi:sn-glycerol 3-phosphate transport system ATP-binding protein